MKNDKIVFGKNMDSLTRCNKSTMNHVKLIVEMFQAKVDVVYFNS